MRRSPCVRLLLCAAVLLGIALPARAQIWAYDGLDYPAATLLEGSNGGAGAWTSPWRHNGDAGGTIVAGSLHFKNLRTTGNSLLMPSHTLAGNPRDFSAIGNTGDVFYVSFLMKPTEPLDVGDWGKFRELRFGPLTIGEGSGDNYFWGLYYGVNNPTTVKVVEGVTYFVVVRITFKEGNDRYEMWINPAPGVPLPTPDAVKEDFDTTIGSQNFGGDGSAQYDELRIGRTWEDVSPTTDSVLLQNQNDSRIAELTLYGTTVNTSVTTSPNLPTGWRVAAYNDFDGDGRKDIVVQNTQTRAVAILYMNGASVSLSQGVYPTLSANWQVMASGDFNADGKPDLVVQNTVTQQVSVLTMVAGKITGSVAVLQKLAPGWSVVGAADFNGDGKTDLVVQSSSTRQISILTMDGVRITGSVPLYPTLPANWAVGAVSDYDGDGKPDLLVQNKADGRLALLSVANVKITASQSITPAPLAGWTLVGPR